mmetsp:Transcript_37528/g.43691  ORF Transcript_37528/g.43691 Transcript_37528/m.43691 type:complete len:426 (-) Transcript_37528:98-1375(-)
MTINKTINFPIPSTITEEFTCKNPNKLQCTILSNGMKDPICGGFSNISEPPNSPRSIVDATTHLLPKPPLTYRRSITLTPRSLSLPDSSPPPQHLQNHRRAKSMTSYQSNQPNARILSRSSSYANDELSDLFECMKLRKSLHGEKHPEVAIVHNSIGNVLQKRNEFDDAMDSYKEALRIYRHEYGDYHTSVASTLQNIGNVHCCVGRGNSAIRYMEQALLIREIIQGSDHPDVADVLQNLGQMQLYLGNHDQSMKNLERSLELRSQLQEEQNGCKVNDTNVARIYNAMGNIQVAKGDFDKALELQQKSLKLKKSIFGHSHPTVAISLMDLGAVCKERGDWDTAISHYKEALRVQRYAYHNQEHLHMELGVTLHTIGSLYEMKGDVVKARKVLTSASSYYKNISLTSDHQCVIALNSSLENLGISS